MKNNNQKLMEAVVKMHPMEFAGLAHLLGVKLVEEEVIEGETKHRPREFTDVFEDLMDKYTNLNRQKQREVLELVKKANRSRGV